ncbi:glycosyltransferase family 39 protein [Amorphus orientalis]|uniref:4-amino-4-deoxy-L-arabinose transferase-like glycosyltransferase n=1 Tax=Amorphus orientalis TaxID=649198 RepID=A0AAE4ATE6_9HYPH|nr:glycosyltransferase family 39 protein [Amorphus orientalis]MDQ0316198.1 4-amino-4-deoxy-L-arabinose transferase-like glycosyltransferase [Amorphus orientalis]
MSNQEHPERRGWWAGVSPLVWSTIAIAVFVLIHARIEVLIRADMAPVADSLVYQSTALELVDKLTKGTLSLFDFLYSARPSPPLFIWSLSIGYILFGTGDFAAYFVSAFWIGLTAFALMLNASLFLGRSWWAGLVGLLFLALPVANLYGYGDTRNDWPPIALLLLCVYFVAASDLFARRGMSLLAGGAAGLALLGKSSMAGYVVWPALVLLVFLAFHIRTLRRRQYINIALCLAVCFVVAGWFYIQMWDVIYSYYSFWAGNNQFKREMYQLSGGWDEWLFFPRNIPAQYGLWLALAVSILAAFAVVAALVSWISGGRVGPRLSRNEGLLVVLCVGLGYLPYLSLLATHSYAGPADLTMIPFQIVLAAMGIWMLVAPSRRATDERPRGFARANAVAIVVAAALIVIMNVMSFRTHLAQPRYAGIHSQQTTEKILAVLDQYGINDFTLFNLFMDLDYNSQTLIYDVLRSPLLRLTYQPTLSGGLNLSKVRGENDYNDGEPDPEPDWVPEGVNLSAFDRYDTLVTNSNVLLYPSRPKGPGFSPLNKEWADYGALLEADPRVRQIGAVTAYRDRTEILVYATTDVEVFETPDQWLPADGPISIVSSPDRSLAFELIGTPIRDVPIDDVRLKMEDGKSLEAQSCEAPAGATERCYRFVVEHDDPDAYTGNLSIDPAVLGAASDADQRRLFLWKPSVRVAEPAADEH